MTQDELLQRDIDLDIELTPAIEDAFYFLNRFEKTAGDGAREWTDEEMKYADDCNKAGDRVAKLPFDERMEAIHYAHRMIDNLGKYGVPCKAWQKN